MGFQNLRHWIRNPIIKEAFNQTILVAKFFCGLHVTDKYLCTVALAQGPSMLPTLKLTGSLVLAERLSTRFGKVGRDDIVIIRSPEEPRKIVLKRIVGVEDDAVTYLSKKSDDQEATVIVPKGHIWIEGDNKHNSRDSRHFGPVSCGLLEGKVFYVGSLLINYQTQNV